MSEATVRRLMSSQEFLEQRSELPDAGQWAELIRGVPVSLNPPDLEHGTTVLNLSKALSKYVHRTLHGYACFDLGIHVEHRPDTILFPAISYFTQGERFAETDNEIAATVPNLVIELLSTHDRRGTINDRITAYRRHGIPSLWLVDPIQQSVHIVNQITTATRRFEVNDVLQGEPALPDFQITVEHLFAPPEWAN